MILSTCIGGILLTGRLWLPGLVLVGVGVAVVVLVVAGRVAQPRVVLADREYLKKWRDIEQWCAVVRRTWPRIGALSGIKDAVPAVNRARWDLARLIAERARLSAAGSEAKFAEYGLDPQAGRAPRVAGRAQQAVEPADSALLSATAWEVRADPAVELSERTEAVLAAYRELTSAASAEQ